MWNAMHDWTIIFPLLALVLSLHIGLRIHGCLHDRRLLRSVTSPCRGEPSERQLVLRLLKAGIGPESVFHDLYIRKRNGGYAQIDVVAVTEHGVIVFEVKDWSGWIFGKDYERHWTQVLSYGREKHQPYNPIMQNAGHINALKSALRDNPDVPFYSAIVFYGNCTLKNVTNSTYRTYLLRPTDIRRFLRYMKEAAPSAIYGDKAGLLRTLRQGVANGDDKEIVESHIRQVQMYA